MPTVRRKGIVGAITHMTSSSAQIISPPDWFSWMLVFGPVYILYEISIKISARAEQERKLRQAAIEQEQLS